MERAIDRGGRGGQVEDGPRPDRAWAGDVACCGVNNRGVAGARMWPFIVENGLEEPGDRVDAIRVQFVTGCLSRLIVAGALSACQCEPG
jgi:hypothetical protein